MKCSYANALYVKDMSDVLQIGVANSGMVVVVAVVVKINNRELKQRRRRRQQEREKAMGSD